MNLLADFHYFSLPVNINHYLCMTCSRNIYHMSRQSFSHFLIISEWSPLRQEPEAPYNNETQASETKCTEAYRSNYPAKQRIMRPPASYGAGAGEFQVAGLKCCMNLENKKNNITASNFSSVFCGLFYLNDHSNKFSVPTHPSANPVNHSKKILDFKFSLSYGLA